jgi:tetratricopeptide (TPR) repeat protein
MATPRYSTSVSPPDSSVDPDLETRVTGDSTPTMASTAHVPLDLGTRLGRYLPIEELGRGGMGTVLRAYDPKLEREVALKVLRGDAVDPSARARMVREARTMAKLGHPNVVAVYDVDDDPRHGVMLAMELVKGSTLQQWLKASPRHWPEILAAFVEAGRGLAAAHAEGLLHRDFKPANVLVAHDGPRGGRGPCKVTDFGLAKLEHEPPASTSSAPAPLGSTGGGDSSNALTQAGTVIGTPRYMAPEQHFGDALTSAADQFSYCVSLWEALYGEPPFTGNERTELVKNVIAGKLRTPTGARAVPRWLRRVCERGLVADPTRRWPSMNAMLDALSKGRTRAGVRKGLAAVGVLALLGVGVEAQRRWALAERTVACETAADEVEVAWSSDREQALRDALLATGVSYAATTADKVTPWLERQAVAWGRARVEGCLDAEVRGQWDAETLDRSLWCLEERRMELQSLVDELTLADADVLPKAVGAVTGLRSVAACRDGKVLEALEPPPQQDREALRVVRADVIRAGNLARAARYDQGLVLAREALGRAEALGWPPLTTAARLELGWLLARSGAYPEAEVELERAYFEAARRVTPELAFDAALGLVYVVGVASARHAEGRLWGEHAEVALQHVPDGEQLRRASLLVDLANLHHRAGAPDRAERLYEQALAIQEESLGPAHPDVATTLNNLAQARSAAGAYDEAKVLLERALAIKEESLGPEHPDVATILGNMALAHHRSGEYDEAKRLHERALALKEKALGPEHPDVADSLNNLAAAYSASGDYDEAKALNERALAIKMKLLGPEHPVVATSLINLAMVHQGTGAHDEARVLYERALAIREKALGPEHPDVAAGLVNLATFHDETGAYEEAKPLYERALALREKSLGPEHPHLGAPLSSLARIALAQHRPHDAVPLARRAVALREKGDVGAERLAEARFVLARALWEAPEDAGRDRVQARTMAEQARDVLRVSGKAGAELAEEVDQWLAGHPGAP